ncbi:hypothetical protein BSKO_09751 [Bryopsis sp. KO-2023]|nr:hypothetical protein BSKO_09751 [Bryopsis sp. KO-2023]
MSSVLEFVDLPDNCVLDILDKCEGRDILRFQLTSRRFLGLGRLPLLWCLKIASELCFEVPKKFSGDYGVLQKIFRSLAGRTDSNTERLDYWGIMTDGGLDDGQVKFWVDNMFQENIEKYYCSKMHRFKDVRCIAIHPPQQSNVSNPIRFKGIQRLGVNGHQRNDNWGAVGSGSSSRNDESDMEILWDEVACVWMKNIAKCSEEQIVVNTGIRIGRMGDLTCPVSCGVVMLGNVDTQKGKISRDGRFMHQLYSSSRTRMSDILSNCMDLESILTACRNRELALPISVCFGESGEWVEFDREKNQGKDLAGKKHVQDVLEVFQPAVWFRFYRKGENTVDDVRRDHLTTEFTGLGVKCRKVEEKVKARVIDHFNLEASLAEMDNGIGLPIPFDFLESDDSFTVSSTSSMDSDSSDSLPELILPPHHENQPQPDAAANANEAQQQEVLDSDSQTSWDSISHYGGEDNIAADLAVWLANEGGSDGEESSDSDSDSDSNNAEPFFNAMEHGEAMYEMLAGQLHEASDYESDETIDWNDDDGDHLQWVVLHSPYGVQRYTSRKSMEGRELMDIELTRPVLANAACVILNGCENFMEEMSDPHEGPNVDVNFVWMMGKRITVRNG